MHAVILAGGLGTRLRPFSITIPKPLLPLGDRPIVDILLTQLSLHGYSSVSICLGYMAPLFQAMIGDGSKWKMKIDYVLEEQPLGTAGALRLIKNLPEHFLVVNGDTLTSLNFGLLYCSHVKSEAVATVFSARINEYVDYGVVEFDSYGTLKSYTEKPTNVYHVSTGVYALSRNIMEHDNGIGRLDMPDLFRRAMEAGQKIYCHREDSVYWRDIGRFDHFEAASKDFQEKPELFFGRQAEKF